MSRPRAEAGRVVNEELYRQYKKTTLDHLRKRGFSKESISEILFAMHVVTSEVFEALVKVAEEIEPDKNGQSKEMLV